jgi:hypothetical protein
VCGGREKNCSLSFHPVCRSRPFDPSPLCLYTTPDGLYQPEKKRKEEETMWVQHNDIILLLLLQRPEPLYPRFQSAIWLSMMRWLEREMIVCEAIRETGTNGLVYTHTHTHTLVYTVYSATVQSQQTPAEDREQKPAEWLVGSPIGPMAALLFSIWWLMGLCSACFNAIGLYFFLVLFSYNSIFVLRLPMKNLFIFTFCFLVRASVVVWKMVQSQNAIIC